MSPACNIYNNEALGTLTSLPITRQGFVSQKLKPNWKRPTMAGLPNRPYDTPHTQRSQLSALSPGRARLCFEIVDNLERFQELQSAWDDLTKRDGKPHHVFQQHNWLSYWCSHFLVSPQHSLAVIVGWRRGRLRFAWPLICESRMGCTIARFMGAPVNQYSDVLIARDEDIGEVLPQAFDILTGELGCHLLMAPHLREDAHMLPALRVGNARPCAEVESPVINLAGIASPDELAAKLNASSRKSRKRRRRRLAEKGAVRLRVAQLGQEAEGLVCKAFAFKTAWFTKHSIVSNAFTDPRFKPFWLDVASGRLGESGLHASALEIDGRPVAVELGLRFKGRHFAHIGAFDLEFEDCSPGQAQLDLIIADCIKDGVTSYDLLPPGSSYKNRLASQSIPVSDFVIPLSRLGAALDGTGITQAPRIAKAVINRLPSGARTMLNTSVKKFRGYFSS